MATVSARVVPFARIARALGMASLGAAITACSPPLSRDQEITVARYLVCYECDAPLLAVRALGDSMPEATVDSLNAALRQGPNAALAAAADTLLRAGYSRDSVWRAANARPPLGPREAHVALAYARYADGYRARGALGMGWIRTPRALRYLDDAISSGQLPPSVLDAARFARDSLPSPNGPPPP